MNVEKSDRGFQFLMHDSYANEPVPARLIRWTAPARHSYGSEKNTI